jgi:hypothetical protein
MIDKHSYPWLPGSVEAVQEYAKNRFGLDVPADVAAGIYEDVLAGRGTADAAIAVYWWATTGQAWIEGVREIWAKLIECLAEAVNQIMSLFHKYLVIVRRVALYHRLPSWIPDGIRVWIAAHWPERWLPEWGSREGYHVRSQQ